MKKSTPLGDIANGIKSNSALVISLAVILVITAFVYIPTVKEELSPRPSEAGGLFDPGFPGDDVTPLPWKPLPDPWDAGPIGPEDFYIFMSPMNATVEAKDITSFEITALRYGDYMGDIHLEVEVTSDWVESAVFIPSTLIFGAGDASTLTITMKDYVENSAAKIEVSAEGEGIADIKTANGVLMIEGDELWWPEGIQTMIAENGKSPDIHNNRVVYETAPDGSWWDIYMKNLNTGETKIIANTNNGEFYPKIYDNYIVWHEQSEDGKMNNICLYDLLTDETKQIVSGGYDPVTKVRIDHRSPNIYENLVVWIKHYTQGVTPYPKYKEILLYDINTETIETIVHFDYSSSQDAIRIRNQSIDIYEDYIVWSDDSANQGIQRIYVHNINSGETDMLDLDDLDKYQKEPAIYDNWVVWLEYIDYDYDFIEKKADLLMAYNLENGQKYTLQSGYNSMEDPSIYQDYVAWSRYWNRIYMHRMSDPIGENHQVTNSPPHIQVEPSIWENKIVWTGYEPFGVYLFEITN